MSPRPYNCYLAALIGLLLNSVLVLAQAPPEEIEVQARGPIHEAFARPNDLGFEPPEAIQKQPPVPIAEEPAESKPLADDVQWIPGYWAWDPDRGEYLWVSGCWRTPPPQRRWVPGHWTQTDAGWQWIPGFWANQDQGEIQYLDPPPAPQLTDVPGVSPGADYTWVPGTWVYRQNNYLWRAGYWLNYTPGWNWISPSFCWTPRGYIFVDGYWDRCFDRRGTLFAPVWFNSTLAGRLGWRYRPFYAVNCNNVLNCLFTQPRWGHYYFGDYFGARYAGLGFQSWFGYGARRHDPLFNYYQATNAGNPAWARGLRDSFQARADGNAPRPPRNWAEQVAWQNRRGTGQIDNQLALLSPVNQLRGQQPVGANDLARQRTEVRTFNDVMARRQAAERLAGQATAQPGTNPPSNATNPARGGRMALPPAGTATPPAPITANPGLRTRPPVAVNPGTVPGQNSRPPVAVSPGTGQGAQPPRIRLSGESLPPTTPPTNNNIPPTSLRTRPPQSVVPNLNTQTPPRVPPQFNMRPPQGPPPSINPNRFQPPSVPRVGTVPMPNRGGMAPHGGMSPQHGMRGLPGGSAPSGGGGGRGGR